MNLVELLQDELKQKNIQDPVLIARYIYIRTGELFDYDPSYEVGNKEIQETLKEKIFNIEEITDFNVICYSWAHLYKDLLTRFGMEAKVIPGLGHQSVEYTIDHKTYVADLTKEYKDITKIKFALATENNYPKNVSKEKRKQIVLEWDDKIGYRKNMKTETVLEMLKKELQEKYPNKEDYIFNTYKVVEYILNVPRKYVRPTSGRKYIYFLLEFFLGEEYHVKSSKIYNIERNTYIQAYKSSLSDKDHFYVYQRQGDQYQFKEVSIKTIEFLLTADTLKSFYARNILDPNDLKKQSLRK